jgi:hypothetical protein
MRYDVECPYCGEGEDINHDDGYGYGQDEKHQQECGSCGKTFVFTTCISYDYDVQTADCLNDADHQYKPTMTVPREYTEMQCSMCGETRPCTPEEFKKVMEG